MLAFAYSECGLSVDDFFNLSLYEWSLEIYKVRKKQENEHKKWESNAAFVREILALIRNVNRGKGQPVITGKEIIKLSFDKVEQKQMMTPEQVESRFPKSIRNGK